MAQVNCRVERPRLASLAEDRRGAISVLGALAMTSVIGASGVAVELGQGYMVSVRNQRVADMASLGAALAYSTNPTDAVLQAEARQIAQANGVPEGAVNARLVASPADATLQAVRVTITTEVPVRLATLIGGASYDVAAASFTQLGGAASAGSPGCMIALATDGIGIEGQGGGSLTANGCAVTTNADIDVQGSASIAAKSVTAGGAIKTKGAAKVESNVPGGSVTANKANAAKDPLANDTRVSDAFTKIGTASPPAAPPAVSAPTTPQGTNWSFTDWNLPKDNDPTRPFWVSGGKYRVPAGNYQVRNLAVGGGITVEVAGTTTMSISNGISHNGAALTFGDGNYKINGSVGSGYSGITFGNGSFEFGGPVSAGGGGTITIGNGPVSFADTVSIASKIKLGNGTHRFGSSITFSGGGDLEMGDGDVDVTSDFTMGGGGETAIMGAGNRRFGGNVTIGGGSIMTMGAGNLSITGGLDVDGGGTTVTMGNGNVAIGSKPKNVADCKQGKGDKDPLVAIYLGGSSKFFMGDGTFTADGCVATQGGGQIKFGKTDNHIIDGNFAMKGGALFGPGRYTIQGDFVNGTGGTGWASGTTTQGVDCATFDLCGVDVTFILSGTIDLGGGAKVKLIAPTAATNGSAGALRELLFASQTTLEAKFGAGSSSILSGALHLPNATVTLSGGASVISQGMCYMVIAKRIKFLGGPTATTECNNLGDGGAGSATNNVVRLVR